MTISFKELGLSEKILVAVSDLGYTDPTPVQEQTIPLILASQDVVAAAQTGTGKTAAFALPILNSLGKAQRSRVSSRNRTLNRERKKGPLCLVVTPTRELAQQIDRVATAVSKQTGHRIVTVVGGVKYDPQIEAIRRGVDVLVATPGRLIDLLDRKAVNLSNVEVLVLDEADRMLDMGFWPSVRKIVAQAPETRQTLLFSATLSSDIMTTAGALLRDPAFVEIAQKGSTAEGIEQFIMPIEQTQKADLLDAVLKEKGCKRVLVFTRTKHRADACAKRLSKQGYSVRAIHADRSQSQRERALEEFRSGKVDILVATDVLARGIDISEISQVFNYDVPNNPEDYVHRIGRTGRAGETGFAITLVGPDEIGDLREIEYLLKKIIPTYNLPDFPYRDGRIIPSPTRTAKRQARNVFRGGSHKGAARRRR